LFSSHLLPDVESVCDYVVVIAAGKLLAEGKIQELKQVHRQSFEVRVKTDQRRFAQRLAAAGCAAEERDELLRVQLPEGETPQLLWRAAVDAGEQIRYLRPQRSTLEEVFLTAVEQA
jgi:ABC-2 type transport system ATP-binding protein